MEEPRRPLGRIDLGLILLLMLLTAGMRLWQVTHTEVLARDSIGYIRMAWQIENLGWHAAVTSATAEQHPGYPLTVLAVHSLGGSWLGDDQPVAWQIAAQIASSVASILLVLPVYLFARRLCQRSCDPAIAFTSVLLLQGLPAIGRLMGDGLSEAVFLVFVACAFWAALRAFDTGKPRWFLLCGLTSGFAYFVRPEGLLVALCTGLVLLARQNAKASRQLWRPWFAQAAAVSLGMLLCVAIFVGATGKVTMKATASRFDELLFGKSTKAAQLAPRTRGPLLAAWWDGPEEAGRSQRVGWAARQLGYMLARGTLYFGWVFGLLGLWWYRARLAQPGVVVLLLVSALIGLLMFRVAWYLGYMSDRHLAVIVLAFTPFIAAGLIETGRRVPRGGVWLSVALVLVLAVPALYRTLLPLHDEREGFREAGEYLASHTNPDDEVIDPFAWTNYYAGRVFQERVNRESKVAYIVHENSSNPHLHLDREMKKYEPIRKKGTIFKSWPIRRGTLEVWAVAR